MIVQYDAIKEARLRHLPRDHPWTTSDSDPLARYVDLKATGMDVAQALEDFSPYSEVPEIQRFFDMVRWINGPHSNIESNDSLFRGPATGFAGARDLYASGRLMVFLRDLEANTRAESVDKFIKDVAQSLKGYPVGKNVCRISYLKYPTRFLELLDRGSPMGWSISYEFNASGLSEAEVFSALGSVFEALWTAFRKC